MATPRWVNHGQAKRAPLRVQRPSAVGKRSESLLQPTMTGMSILIATMVVAQLGLIFGFVLLERRHPAATMAWILAIGLLPGLGVFLYLTVGRRHMTRQSKRTEIVASRVNAAFMALDPLDRLADDRPACSARTAQLITLGTHVGTLPALPNNRCTLLTNGPGAYRAIFQSIATATEHIHVLFYAIHDDSMGHSLRERLCERASEGIDVRVLTDGVGSFGLPGDFWQPLVDVGGACAQFSPVGLLTRFRRKARINFRNHRKIVVIDGGVGFLGGMNIGAEYLGRGANQVHWRDTHMRVEGPAVIALQRTFAEDWLWATGEVLDAQVFRFGNRKGEADAGSLVQIVDSGPDRRWRRLERLYVQAIAEAKERVWITSPYFIPSIVMDEALTTAALRGVDVRLLLPHTSDHPIVALASRATFPNLLESGVRIFEYHPGFVHAKTMVVDDWVCAIGSANMDNRSFRLNFEVSAFIYDKGVTDALAQDFREDLDGSREVSLMEVNAVSYGRRIAQSLARLFSPLL